MPVTVYRLPNEPILIATFTGIVDSATMVTMFQKSAELIGDDSMVFRVTDFRQIDSTIEEVLRVMGEIRKNEAGSTTDTRIRPVLLGDNRWVKIAQDIIRQMYGMELPVFSTMGESMTFIRALLARRAS